VVGLGCYHSNVRNLRNLNRQSPKLSGVNLNKTIRGLIEMKYSFGDNIVIAECEDCGKEKELQVSNCTDIEEIKRLVKHELVNEGWHIIGENDFLCGKCEIPFDGAMDTVKMYNTGWTSDWKHVASSGEEKKFGYELKHYENGEVKEFVYRIEDEGKEIHIKMDEDDDWKLEVKQTEGMDQNF